MSAWYYQCSAGAVDRFGRKYEDDFRIEIREWSDVAWPGLGPLSNKFRALFDGAWTLTQGDACEEQPNFVAGPGELTPGLRPAQAIRCWWGMRRRALVAPVSSRLGSSSRSGRRVLSGGAAPPTSSLLLRPLWGCGHREADQQGPWRDGEPHLLRAESQGRGLPVGSRRSMGRHWQVTQLWLHSLTCLPT